MTIRITIKNEDSRENAIVAVVATDKYKWDGKLSSSSTVLAHLSGGQNVETYLTDTREISVIETKNG